MYRDRERERDLEMYIYIYIYTRKHKYNYTSIYTYIKVAGPQTPPQPACGYGDSLLRSCVV